MEREGAVWGMRPEVAAQAAESLHELMIYLHKIGVTPPVRIETRFEEFNLDVNIQYTGPPIRLSDEPPTLQSIASEIEALPLLSAYILRKSADTFRVSSHGQKSRIDLHFDH
jgi:hypothetical protein